eukprot:GFUD01133287.1.p1 GENE.GFUD01133287.1~~GFUD01133287.1.p1  ORF type:complete len:529 (+),score=142.95 GFUD01133287.1:141-1589(+)
MASAQMMGKNFLGSRGRFPGPDRKFGKRRDGQVGQAVREVIIKAMCNYSSNVNITTNTTSSEFNTTTGNSSDWNSCEQCFLSTPLSEIFSESGGENASACTKEFLPDRFRTCAVGIDFGNSSSEETADCYKDALKNATIEFCSNMTNSSDPVDRFQSVMDCLKRNKKDFKKEVRMAMMDRVIGGKGCSFSAMIALKLFGDKKRSSLKKDMDFDDALDDMLTEELEEDDLKNTFQWTKDIKRPNRGGYNKGAQNRGGYSNQYNRGNGGYADRNRTRGGRPRQFQVNGRMNGNNQNRGGASGRQGFGGRGQGMGGSGKASGGNRFQGGNMAKNRGGVRFGGKGNQGGSQSDSDYDQYDYNNIDYAKEGNDYDSYDGGNNGRNGMERPRRDQGQGGRMNQNNQDRGGGGNLNFGSGRSQISGGRNQIGQGKGKLGNKQGGGWFGGNGRQEGGRPNSVNDQNGNGGDEFDYDSYYGGQDYDYKQED